MAEKGKTKHTTSAARKARYSSYRALHIREKAKLLRVLKSNGKAAAQAYATLHGLAGLLAQIAKRRGVSLGM